MIYFFFLFYSYVFNKQWLIFHENIKYKIDFVLFGYSLLYIVNIYIYSKRTYIIFYEIYKKI